MSSATTHSTDGIEASSSPNDGLGKRVRNKLDKKRRIVDAATELFQEQGFDETTTAEIAEKAGIGAGTLYLYVDSKEDLLVSVFEAVAGDAWSRAFERVDRSAPVLQQVTSLFLSVTEHHRADQRLSRSFFKELPWLEPPARQGADDFVLDFLGRLEALLADAAGRGLLDPEVPCGTVAVNLYSLWVQEMRRHVAGRLSHEDMTDLVAEAFRVALWGMTPAAE